MLSCYTFGFESGSNYELSETVHLGCFPDNNTRLFWRKCPVLVQPDWQQHWVLRDHLCISWTLKDRKLSAITVVWIQRQQKIYILLHSPASKTDKMSTKCSINVLLFFFKMCYYFKVAPVMCPCIYLAIHPPQTLGIVWLKKNYFTEKHTEFW